MKDYITVIGAGLAGCEAAYQIAKRGIKVKLYEMKPIKYSEAHSNENFAEIVCSNSFKSKCGFLYFSGLIMRTGTFLHIQWQKQGILKR